MASNPSAAPRVDGGGGRGRTRRSKAADAEWVASALDGVRNVHMTDAPPSAAAAPLAPHKAADAPRLPQLPPLGPFPEGALQQLHAGAAAAAAAAAAGGGTGEAARRRGVAAAAAAVAADPTVSELLKRKRAQMLAEANRIHAAQKLTFSASEAALLSSYGKLGLLLLQSLKPPDEVRAARAAVAKRIAELRDALKGFLEDEQLQYVVLPPKEALPSLVPVARDAAAYEAAVAAAIGDNKKPHLLRLMPNATDETITPEKIEQELSTLRPEEVRDRYDELREVAAKAAAKGKPPVDASPLMALVETVLDVVDARVHRSGKQVRVVPGVRPQGVNPEISDVYAPLDVAADAWALHDALQEQAHDLSLRRKDNAAVRALMEEQRAAAARVLRAHELKTFALDIPNLPLLRLRAYVARTRPKMGKREFRDIVGRSVTDVLAARAGLPRDTLHAALPLDSLLGLLNVPAVRSALINSVAGAVEARPFKEEERLTVSYEPLRRRKVDAA